MFGAQAADSSSTRTRALCVAVCLLVVLLTACGRRRTRIPTVAPPPIGVTEVGIASWYGHPYHGRRAANGEVYDMEKLTAAHRTLPFGTWVRVLNLTNSKTINVRINDRGPFVDGRIIDLSRAAARAIDMIGPGVVKVRIEVIDRPASATDFYAVQVGAFSELSNARSQRAALEAKYGSAELVLRDGDPPLWRVLVGDKLSSYEAAGLAERIRAEFGPAFVVLWDDD